MLLRRNDLRQGLLFLSVASLLLAGCLGPAASGLDDASTDDTGAEEEAPRDERPPNGRYGLDPVLRPGSDFEETPWGYARSDWVAPEEPLPVVFMMDGYMGASQPHPTHYLRMRDGVLVALSLIVDHPLLPEGYVLAWASIRGTGCSAGTFDLFDQAHAMDGYEFIEWIAAQGWSTGKVGLFGASYSGITAFLIAATQPPHLEAMSASMVIADLYRDIAYPGGVPNIAFPVEWTILFRPIADLLGTYGGVASQDEICAQNLANRPPGYPADNPTVALFTRTVDDPAYAVRSLINYAHLIQVPTYIAHAWQDEQTGPRGGPAMFEAIHPPPVLVDGDWLEPKKLVTTNGVHGTAAAVAITDAARWFDHWLRGIDTGLMQEPPVKMLFNTDRDGFTYEADEVAIPLEDWPAPGTVWQRHYFGADGAMVQEPDQPASGSDAYLSGTARQSWSFEEPTLGGDVTNAAGPDVLSYLGAPAEEPWLLAGPMTAELYVSTTGTDTDLFVSIADVAPDGATTYLARGLLRASHRALDLDRTVVNSEGDIIRPYHPHTHPEGVSVGEMVRYDIEVFPLSHVVHAGHQLQVRIHTPPLGDGAWGYQPVRQPTLNTVHYGPDTPSSLLLPVVPWEGPWPSEPACGAPDGYRCVHEVAVPAAPDAGIGAGSQLPRGPSGPAAPAVIG